MVVGCFRTIGVLTGKITDTSSNPVPGATILVEPGPYSATTDANGNYRVEQVPFGDYRVTATSGTDSAYEDITLQNESFIGCNDLSINTETVEVTDITLDLTPPNGDDGGTSTGTLVAHYTFDENLLTVIH